LWALEEIGWSSEATMSVVTQGSNVAACKCYERFGFALQSTQKVFHAWLPDHLQEHVSVCDSSPIPFCKQHLTGNEVTFINQVLHTGLDSAAHFTLMCSAKMQEILGEDSERVIMVPSGTAALEMAALLCEFEVGDEVIMPSYTFSSTANAFVLRGVAPVFVDCTEDDVNMDHKLVEQAITSKTKAVCVVHYGGVPCDMDEIKKITDHHKLFLIEDAAQGFFF
jgi:dTDP-4-amino-4,6-dideoxygalactose transaminase